MKYETAKQAAERSGVTVRTIQKRACAGKIPGAYKSGNIWLIPESNSFEDSCEMLSANNVNEEYNIFPLLNGTFKPGRCLEFIKCIEDERDKLIAMCEYYYFTGECQKAVDLYASRFTDTNSISKQINNKAYNSLLSKISVTLFKGENKNVQPLECYVSFLPGGLKLFAHYLLSYDAFLEGDYEKGTVIAESGIISAKTLYPVALVYTHIIAAINLIRLFRIKEGRKHLIEAWNIAEKDNIIQPFVRHYDELMGLLEITFKKQKHTNYEKIKEICEKINNYNNDAQDSFCNKKTIDGLSNIEYIIAMMFCNNRKIKEIAEQIGLTEREVKTYLNVIYQKLNISSREELKKYINKIKKEL